MVVVFCVDQETGVWLLNDVEFTSSNEAAQLVQIYAELEFFVPQLGQVFEANAIIYPVALTYQTVASAMCTLLSKFSWFPNE